MSKKTDNISRAMRKMRRRFIRSGHKDSLFLTDLTPYDDREEATYCYPNPTDIFVDQHKQEIISCSELIERMHKAKERRKGMLQFKALLSATGVSPSQLSVYSSWVGRPWL